MSNPNNNSNSETTTTTATFEGKKAAEETAAAEAGEVVVVWTTWEELLLASAVKRHGVRDWEAVAMEVQNRSTANSSSLSLLTPRICEQKFNDLQRRFAAAGDDVSLDGDDVTVPLLEELRKLRVAELRQEVQRYDLSIQSLQIQVKRLEGERERSSKASEPEKEGVNRSDLEKDNITNIDNKNSNNLNSIKEEAERSENDKKDPGKSSPEKEQSGEDENRSVNESNSSGNRGTGSGLKSHPEPVEVKPEPKPVGSDSCNDSSDRHNEEMKRADSGELRGGDSVDGGGTATTKESSDVQSTASLTRKRRRLRKIDGVDGGEGGGGGGGFKGGDKAAVVTTGGIKRRESLVKCEPLIEFLDVIRSFKDALIFERRLDSQKTDKYKNMIRQHVDLGLVQARIDDGSYSSCLKKFYLDLLLLFNNAIVFFPKSSPESRAANSLRVHVMEELKKIRNTFEPIHESTTSVKMQPKPELERSDSLLVKHRSTSPIVVVCRKRSSIGVKPSSSGTKSEKLADNKSLLTLKPPVKSSSSTPNEDDSLIKLKLKEKPVTGARSVRRGSKSRPNSNPTQSNPNSNQNTSSSSQQAGSAQKGEETKVAEKKKTELSSAAKKRGAADFLKRIKKNSPAKGSSLAEALKGSGDDSNGSKTELKKKVEIKKVSGPLRRSGNGSGTGGGRQLKGGDSPSKKNVGRPPKKGKDLPPPKRGRDDEGEGSSKRPVKRSRR